MEVWRLCLTWNFALNPKINVLYAMPGKLSNCDVIVAMVTNSQNTKKSRVLEAGILLGDV